MHLRSTGRDPGDVRGGNDECFLYGDPQLA